jgi:hypothetical protein
LKEFSSYGSITPAQYDNWAVCINSKVHNTQEITKIKRENDSQSQLAETKQIHNFI